MRRWAVVLLLLFLARCSTPTKVFRLDTGQGVPMLYVPHREVEPVAVSEEEFRRAIAKHAPSVPAVEHPLEHARQVFGVPERSGWYRYESRSHRLTASAPGSDPNGGLSPEDVELKRRYLEWCAQEWGPGDCLRLLVDKPFLDGDDKYALAMAMAHSKVLAAMKEELSRLVSPQAVAVTVVAGMAVYAILLALPEPVTKGLAALLTLGAGAYLGWDTVWRLIDGWLVLMKDIALAPNAVAMAARGNSGGPGDWVKAGESMPEQARRYQAQVTRAPEGYVYRVKLGDKNVKFDGFDEGVLIETKATGYAQWVDKNLNFAGIFKGRLQMLEQARRQLEAARGTPIRWIVAEEKLAGALRKMFAGAGFPIEVVHIPPKPIP